jgi:hypothetical protein
MLNKVICFILYKKFNINIYITKIIKIYKLQLEHHRKCDLTIQP